MALHEVDVVAGTRDWPFTLHSHSESREWMGSWSNLSSLKACLQQLPASSRENLPPTGSITFQTEDQLGLSAQTQEHIGDISHSNHITLSIDDHISPV